MMNKNVRIMGIVFLLGICISILSSSLTSAVLSKPEWEEEDYWEYKITYYSPDYVGGTRNATFREEVVGWKNITVNGMNYSAIIIQTTSPEKEEYWARDYYTSSNLSLIKCVNSDNYTVVFHQPWDRWHYPIQIGERWKQEVNETRHYPNDHEYKFNYTSYYNCTGKTEISVPAGTFLCYKIKEYGESDENSYNMFYISSEAGREVKTESYSNGELSSEEVLLSFSYHGRTSEDENEESFIPSFEVLSLLGGMSIAAIMILRKTLKK